MMRNGKWLKKPWKWVPVLLCLALFSPMSLAAEGNETVHNEKPSIFVQTGHTEEVTSVTVCPNSKYVLSGGEDNSIKIWDIETGREIRSFYGHKDKILSISCSSDGQYAFSVSYDSIKLWSIKTGKEIQTYRIPKDNTEKDLFDSATSFSPDDNYVVLISNIHDPDCTTKMMWSGLGIKCDERNLGMWIWERKSGNVISSFQKKTKAFTQIAITKDGKNALLSINDSSIQVWDIAKGKKIRTLKCGSATKATIPISSDNKYAISTTFDKTVDLWDIEKGKIIWANKMEKDIKSVSFSSDSKYVLTLDDENDIQLWETNTGKEVRKIINLINKNNSGRLFPTNNPIYIFISYGKNFVMVDLDAGNIIQSFYGLCNPLNTSAIDQSGQYALTGGDSNKINLWNLKKGNQTNSFIEHNDSIQSLKFSPDGNFAISGSDDETIKLWPMKKTGSTSKTFTCRSTVKSVDFFQDGSKILYGGGESSMALLDLKTGETIHNFEFDSNWPIFSVSSSSNGKYIINSHYGRLFFWDIESYKNISTINIESKTFNRDPVAFSPDCKYAIVGGHNGLQLFDVLKSKEIRIFGGSGDIASVAFTSDNKNIISGSVDNDLILWDISTGKKCRSFVGHYNSVTSVSASRDGKYALSGSRDGTLRLWDISTGIELCSYISFTNDEWIAITPEGFFNASSNGAKYLNVRVGNQVYAIDQLYNSFYRPDLVQAKINGDPDGLVRQAAERLDIALILAGGNAPQATFVSPKPGLMGKRDVLVDVSLADQGGGFGKVEWRLNGITVEVMTEPDRGLKRVTAESNSADLKATVTFSKWLTLSPGKNRIEIVAYNKDGGIASDPIGLDLELKDAISDPPSLYILSVGVNKYRDKSLWLNYAVPDGKDLVQVLKKQGKGIFTDIIALELYDQDVTMAGISAAFDQISKKARSNDVFVFYLAGHGITLDGIYHFLPMDFRYNNEDSVRKNAVNQDHIQAWMSRIQSAKSLVLLDTCNSGSFIQAQAVMRGIAEKTAIDKLTRATGRATISASSDSQVALEGYEGHGIFTYALIKALTEADVKNGNKDGSTSTNEIASFVSSFVPDTTLKKWGYEQNPQINLVGREFPIGLSK